MSIIGIGIDIVDVDRVNEGIGKNKSFTDRILTAEEHMYCNSKRNPYPFIAARIAAKEAVYKVIGNMIKNLYWKDIEIVSMNAPPVISSGCKAGRYITQNNIGYSLTISHEQKTAVACAVFWRK